MNERRNVFAGIAAGHWRGSVRTWLDPTAPPVANDIVATSAHVLDGPSVRLEYRSRVEEHRSDGLMVMGIDMATNRPCLTWIDTFHTGSNVGVFAADDRDLEDGVSLGGAYAAGDEVWRWRIVVHASPGQLRIEHFNISPAGNEDRAIEVILAETADDPRIH